MTVLRQVWIAGLVLVGYVLTLQLGSLSRHWLTPVVGDTTLALALSVSVLALLWMLPFLHPGLHRSVNLMHPRRTWTLLLLLPYPLIGLMAAQAPSAIDTWEKTAYLAWFGIGVSLFEELLFRGYALMRSDAHPRVAILVSSAAFTFVHWMGGHPPLFMVPVFFFGLAFGIVRIASGSLAWCVLFHAITNVIAAVFDTQGSAGAFALHGLAGSAGLIVLWRHPNLQARTVERPLLSNDRKG